MNESSLILKKTLLIYSEYKKINKSIYEQDFYEIIKKSLRDNQTFLESNLFSNKFSSEFLKIGRSLCEYESLTFMPDDYIDDYQKIKESTNFFILRLSSKISIKYPELIKNFSENDWRKIIGICDSFSEWTSEIQYFKLNKQDKLSFISESPLLSLCRI